MILPATVAMLVAACDRPILHPLHRLEGTWQRSTRSGLVCETWAWSGPELLLGRGFQVGSKGDTTLLESLRLLARGEAIVYEATVPDQNGGKPVEFALAGQGPEAGAFTFENLAHDFPQRIVYRFVGSDSLEVRLEDRGGKGFDLHYRRAE